MRSSAAAPVAAPHTPCFTEGTEIATDCGAVRIEDLRVGDRVLTRDSGYRPIRWIGARHFDENQLAAFPELRPMTIRTGALGAGVPERDLSVSPQHRMLVTAYGQDEENTEVLVAAIDLACARTSDERSVTYYHILFDAHEVVMADGAWSESFLPGAEALGGLHAAQRDEILTIFPELRHPHGIAAYTPARHCPAPDEAAPLVNAA
ncbi:Hint domain-containing protein [Albidovulum aquaemixtae]|uniref:Hint domain-containing protein n=1 Tax=Albidovulum aquaemixtae TaxID=1542388 RepID=UPI001FE74E14|nr:Hint domain-containing protein [Defluviimonas aquaemixtae]